MTGESGRCAAGATWRAGRTRVAALMLADAAGLALVWAAVVLAYDWTFGIDGIHPVDYLQLWPIIPLFVSANVGMRLYHGSCFYPAIPFEPVEEFRRLFVSSLAAHLLLMAFLGYARVNTRYSRIILFVAGLAAGLFAQPARNACRRLLRRLGVGQIPVAVVGDARSAQSQERVLRYDPHYGLRVAACAESDAWQTILPACRRHGVTILLACQDVRIFRNRFAGYADCFSHIVYLPSGGAFPVLGGRVVSLGGDGGIEMVNRRVLPALRAEKAILDRTLAIAVFAATLPLFAAIALLVALTSRGGVFYRQSRLGVDGREFRIWKFRTMYVDAEKRLERLLARNGRARAEWRRNFKLARDPRTTPLGRLLRKTSLDELPQLFNVFRGEMSLVGPRPIVRQEVPYYGAAHELIRQVKPGVTGLWQVSGRSDTGYERRVAMDVFYVLNWNTWLDIWVLVRTVFAVVTMRGAQ